VLVNIFGGVVTIYGRHLTRETDAQFAHSHAMCQCTTQQHKITLPVQVRLKSWALQKLKAWVCPKYYISRESKTWGCKLCLGYLLINSPTNPKACGFSSGVCWVMNTDILNHEYCYPQPWILLWRWPHQWVKDLVLMRVGRESNTRATGVTILWHRPLVTVLRKLPHISTDQMVGNQLITRNRPIVFL